MTFDKIYGCSSNKLNKYPFHYIFYPKSTIFNLICITLTSRSFRCNVCAHFDLDREIPEELLLNCFVVQTTVVERRDGVYCS